MKNIFLLVFIFLHLNLFSQREAANWYFGFGAGIQFNQANGTVTSVNDGQLSTIEGCSSISDENGNLLFYSDGTTVWNRNNDVMQNGFGLFGDSSSTQSAIIVQKPDFPDIYYIFTVDNELDGFNNGFNYSEIDMTLDGGLGAVTLKNSNLLALCSEKITAVLKDCISKSIWVITFASENGFSNIFDSFHAFEVTTSGVNTTSVVSRFFLSVEDARGYLKASPDGEKLAIANVTDGLFLYDFDINTGTVSNQQQLIINTQSAFAYGIEFSPNNQFLYVHASNNFFSPGNPAEANDPANHSSTLTQFDVTIANIQASEFTLDQRQLYRGALQLGPDGRIYRALSATYNSGLPFLGVINNPNTQGAGSDYQHNAIDLSPNNSSQGLPPFNQSLFNLQIDIIKNGLSTVSVDICDGDSYTLVSEDIVGATYIWTKDGTTLPETDLDLVVDEEGLYEVYIDPNNGDCSIEGNAYVRLISNPEANDTSLIQCDEDGVNDGLTIFNLNEATATITGNTADRITLYFTSPTATEDDSNAVDANAFANTSNPQTLYAKVTNTITGCFNIAELTLEVSLTDANDALLEKCDDDGTEDGFYNFNLDEASADVLDGLPADATIRYYEIYEDALLEVNELNLSYTNIEPYSQIIYARVETNNNCYGISEVELVVFELPQIVTSDEFIYCLNFFPETITLNAAILEDEPLDYIYTWSVDQYTYEIQINEVDTYTVTVTNFDGCSKERTINVVPSNTATIESVEVIDATTNNVITITISGEGNYEFSLNEPDGPYQDSNTFENVRPGFHTVYVRDKNNCGVVNTIVSVIGFPKFFTPNNDSYNDTWQVYGINTPNQFQSEIYIFDRYGKLLAQLSPKGQGWDGTYNGNPVPTGDYWFYVVLQDGRSFRDHFTLKR